ncbi:hypothetical protein G2W53_044903 [Senna tora]|uniref:Uncharacterized protein n=1 Tax=Senna tora TaxID=362788 RepID=A0A834VY61_9FABA|nr:hypothetical protein G2W53_044903 [Senna tora]
MGSPLADARSAHVPKHARQRALPSTIATTTSPQASTAWAWAAAVICIGPHARADRRPANAVPHPTGHTASPHPLPSRQISSTLDSLFKVLFIFPRGTCSLSVSRPYLALDGIYRPIGAAFPTTRLADSASCFVAPKGSDSPSVGDNQHKVGLEASAHPPWNVAIAPHRLLFRPSAMHGSREAKFPPSTSSPPDQSGGGRGLGLRCVTPRQRAHRPSASGATCVQRLDGSRDSAIHTKYRISLRSSSMREPRYPLPRVILISFSCTGPGQEPSPVRRGHTPIVSTRAPSGGLRATHAARLPPRECFNQFASGPVCEATTMILPQACFEHSNFFKVTAPEARPGQLRPGAHRRQKGRADRAHQRRTDRPNPRLALQWILVKGFRLYSFQLPDSMSPVLLFIVTTSPCQDWVICAPAAFLGCVAVSQAPSPESNPNSPSPVTTMVAILFRHVAPPTPLPGVMPGRSLHDEGNRLPRILSYIKGTCKGINQPSAFTACTASETIEGPLGPPSLMTIAWDGTRGLLNSPP